MTPHPAVLARRRRIQTIRARVAAGAVALFIALFGGLYVQMASGNDPALSASSAQVASTSTATDSSVLVLVVLVRHVLLRHGLVGDDHPGLVTMLVAPDLPAGGVADGVLVVADGEVVLANEALRRMVGGDLVGRPAPDWLPSAPPSGEGPLTALERAHVRRHATIGAAMAADVLDAEQAGWLRHHHERDDGGGYPDRLAGDAIPAAPASSRSRTPSTR